MSRLLSKDLIHLPLLSLPLWLYLLLELQQLAHLTNLVTNVSVINLIALIILREVAFSDLLRLGNVQATTRRILRVEVRLQVPLLASSSKVAHTGGALDCRQVETTLYFLFFPLGDFLESGMDIAEVCGLA